MPLIVLIILGIVVLYIISTYNSMASMRTRIHASIQEIGNQLKRQAELIPNLEESAKGYLKHEKEIIKMLADARKVVMNAVSSGDLGKLSAAGEKVSQLIPHLRLAVESNPNIKGADVVTKLMDELRDTSDKVMYARRTLIDLSADYNIALVTFPSNMIAKMFGFAAEKGLDTPTSGGHLEVSSEEIKTPKVKLE